VIRRYQPSIALLSIALQAIGAVVAVFGHSHGEEWHHAHQPTTKHTAHAHGCCCHSHHVEHEAHEHDSAPADHHDDCSICRHFSQPVVAASLIILPVASDHVQPVALTNVERTTAGAPLITTARGPPTAAL
jgi:hypothetical protein